MIVLNVDDYHNIDWKRRADNATISEVHHLRTILLKAAPGIPALPFMNLRTGKDIINPNGIDSDIMIGKVHHSIFLHFWLTYNERKMAFARELPEASNHDEHIEMLLIHSRLIHRRADRSMNNTKLVNLVEGSLQNGKF
ncbi:1066_t:CDS:1, partial [Paraglomus occultum]